MKNYWVFIALIVILGVVEIYADIALKKWANATGANKQHWGLAAGIVVYALVGLLYGVTLLFGDISIGNTLWQVFSIVIVFGLGISMFDESPTIGQWVGLVVILVGMTIMLTAYERKGLFWTRPWNPFRGLLGRVAE